MDTVRHKTTLSLRLNFHYNWNIWNTAEITFELRPFLNEQGQLISLPAKNQKKLLAIWYLAERIPARRTFTEAEINDAIDDQTTFRDHATHERRKDLLEGRDGTDAAGISGEVLLRRRKWTLNL